MIEAKKPHKAGERSSCSAILMVGELRGRGLAALAYEIKTYENLFCGLFGQIYENLHKQKFLLYGTRTKYATRPITLKSCKLLHMFLHSDALETWK